MVNSLNNYMTGTVAETEVKAYGNKELNQNDFMKLLSAQLQHQDPMKPMENGEFIAEMAQFSQLENSKNLNNSFKTLSQSLLSSGALNASMLVGKTVSFNTENFQLAQEGASFSADNPVSGNVSVNITDSAGASVFTKSFAAHPASTLSFNWDGTNGKTGDFYKVKITNESSEQPITARLEDRVSSVNISGSEIAIRLANNGSISRNDLIEILDK